MSSQDIKEQIIANLHALSPRSRDQISSIDVHPHTFVALCMAVRADSPVAPAPKELYGIKINVNADLKVPYSLVIAMKSDGKPIKMNGYRPQLIICDDLISE